MLQIILKINDFINEIVWGIPMIILLLGIGIYLTIRFRFFQVTRVRLIFNKTIRKLFSRKVREEKGDVNISPFQAFCTALAATIGVGNITGVSAAIIIGGPGALCWMWISAFFGMMTLFAENILGVKFRVINDDGEWSGGPMYYLQNGLGRKKYGKAIGRVLAVSFSIFCVMASIGMGNMSQVNAAAEHLNSEFGIDCFYTGLVLMLLGCIVIFGGIKRVAGLTEHLVPFLSIVYVIASIYVIVCNRERIGEAFSSIFNFAFGLRPLGGAAAGMSLKIAVEWGLKRGVFSNEAGMGSSVLIQSSADSKEPVEQGMWGIVEVFADTILMCTLTGLVILTSGLVNFDTGRLNAELSTVELVSGAFDGVFFANGTGYGGKFVAVMVLLFAFSTTMGWSCFGVKAWEYLYGTENIWLYRMMFVVFMFIGSVLSMEVVLNLSDTFNGLMIIPNAAGLIVLSNIVIVEGKKYLKGSGSKV